MARDNDAAKLARDSLLQYIRREPHQVLRAGPISLWLRGGLNLDTVEGILDRLVNDGILRSATPEELKQTGFHYGYVLTPEGAAALPPEDRSYGAL